MRTTSNFKYLSKIVKILSPPIAFGVSFFIILLFINVAAGDIATWAYGGIRPPPESMLDQGFTLEQYEAAMQQYEDTKSQLEVPDFPMNLFYVLIHYLAFDFGTNWETLEPIFEEISLLAELSIILLFNNLIITFIVLSPLMVVFYDLKQRSRNDSIGSMFIKGLGIISPSFLLLWLFFLLEVVVKGGLSTVVNPVYRGGSSIVSNLILPVSLTVTLALIPGLIVLASGASNRTVFKISAVAVVFTQLWNETIFAWPGVGRYLFRAVTLRNYPVLLACFSYIAFIIMVLLVIIELPPSQFLDESPKDHISIRTILGGSLPFDTQRMRREVIMIGALGIFLIFLTISFLFAPFHPLDDDYTKGFPSYASPGGQHILGTNWGGQDIFSRVLYSFLNVILFCCPFGIIAVFGYLIFSIMNQKFRLITILILSFITIVTLMSLFAIIPSLQDSLDNPGGKNNLLIASIFLMISMGFSTGFLFSSWKIQLDSVDMVCNLRQVFAFSVLFQFIFIEFLSFLGLGAHPNSPSFGGDIDISRSVLFTYPWVIYGPLLVLILVLIVFLIFALVKLPDISWIRPQKLSEEPKLPEISDS